MIDLPPPFICHVSHVTDGDTIRCGDTRVRLARIDAADNTSSPRCKRRVRGAWCDNRAAAIGKVTLTRIIAGRALRCVPVPATDRARTAYDRYGRVVARCSVNGTDIGEAMVAAGAARRWP